MIFRLTGKLSQKLHVRPEEALPLHECPYADWSACVFIANRRHYVLLSNTASLFSVVIPGAGIADADTFCARALEAINDRLKEAGCGDLWLQTQNAHGTDIRFSKGLNPSVTAGVTALVKYCKRLEERREMTPDEWGRLACRYPMKMLGDASPEEAFAALADAPPKEALVVGRSAKGGAERLNHRQSYVHRRSFERVLQFKIWLKHVQPAVWRRIQVPEDYTFWDLHCAISDSLGWLDYHLHEFRLEPPIAASPLRVGIPMDDGFEGMDVLEGRDIPVKRFLSRVGDGCTYTYDFGDDWVHAIALEAILPRQEKLAYPCCIDGERACPPEDAGGAGGYAHFLKAMEDASHPEHDMLLNWVGGPFDPDWFDMKIVRFANPQVRWRVAFDNEAPPNSLRMVQYHCLRRGGRRPR